LSVLPRGFLVCAMTALVMAIAIAPAAWAQAGQAPTAATAPALALPDRALTLMDCLRFAVENRPSLQAAEAQLEAARAATRRQEARHLPKVTALWDWRTNQTLARPIRLPGGVIATKSERITTRDASASLDMTFYQRGTREAIRQARAREQSTYHQREDRKRLLLEDVAVLFYTVLANRELAQVTAEAVLSAQRHLAMVDARIEAGTAARADRLPVEVELAQARLRAVQAENAWRRSLADLRAAMGLPAGAALTLAGSLKTAPMEEDLQELCRLALRQRPDLEAQRQSVQASEWSLRLAKISAGLSLSALGHAEYGRYSGIQGNSWWLGVGASLPIFDRQSHSDVQAAEENLKAARLLLEDAELQACAEVEAAYLALTEAAERVQQALKNRQAAEVNLRAAEERYREQVAAIIEVTDAEQSLREAQADYVQAVYDQNIARVRLDSAVGNNLLETLGASQ